MSARLRVFRWKAVGPLAVFLVLLGVLYWVLVDQLVRWGVEDAGTALGGAKVDGAAADVRLRDGVGMRRGRAGTNPAKPMTNLLAADQSVDDVRAGPLRGPRAYGSPNRDQDLPR